MNSVINNIGSGVGNVGNLFGMTYNVLQSNAAVAVTAIASLAKTAITAIRTAVANSVARRALTLRLITQDMNGEERQKVSQAVSRVFATGATPSERRAFADRVLQLTEGMSGNAKAKIVEITCTDRAK